MKRRGRSYEQVPMATITTTTATCVIDAKNNLRFEQQHSPPLTATDIDDMEDHFGCMYNKETDAGIHYHKRFKATHYHDHQYGSICHLRHETRIHPPQYSNTLVGDHHTSHYSKRSKVDLSTVTIQYWSSLVNIARASGSDKFNQTSIEGTKAWSLLDKKSVDQIVSELSAAMDILGGYTCDTPASRNHKNNGGYYSDINISCGAGACDNISRNDEPATNSPCSQLTDKISNIALVNILIKYAIYRTRDPSPSLLLHCSQCLEELYSLYHTEIRDRTMIQNLRALFFCLRGWLRRSDYENALTDFTSAIEIHHNFTIALNNRGVLMDIMNRRKAAISDYTRAIESGPVYAKAYFNRSLLLEVMEEYVLSLRDAAMAFQLEPNDTDIERHYSDMKRRVRLKNRRDSNGL